MINNEDFFDEIGNNHIATNEETPLRADAFVQSDEEKIESIKADVEKNFKYIRSRPTDDS
jgi:GTP cyclohydrolase I